MAVEPANADATVERGMIDPRDKFLFDQSQSPPQPGPTTALEITSVRWGVTVNLGNYSSVRLAAEADVGTGGSAESTLESLVAWVDAHTPPNEQTLEKRWREYHRLQDETRDLQQLLDKAKLDWQAVKRVFDRLGMPLPQNAMEDLPF